MYSDSHRKGSEVCVKSVFVNSFPEAAEKSF